MGGFFSLTYQRDRSTRAFPKLRVFNPIGREGEVTCHMPQFDTFIIFKRV